MTQRNSSAVAIGFAHINAQLSKAVNGLAGKRLVHLHEINVLVLDTEISVEVLDGEYRANAHLIGSAASDLCTSKTGNRLQAMSISPGPASENGA
jgi:hypothetical protein